MLIVGILIGAAIVYCIYNRDKVTKVFNRVAADIKEKTDKK